jgi:hypothetical protein
MCGNRSWHTYAMHPTLPLGNGCDTNLRRPLCHRGHVEAERIKRKREYMLRCLHVKPHGLGCSLGRDLTGGAGAVDINVGGQGQPASRGVGLAGFG